MPVMTHTAPTAKTGGERPTLTFIESRDLYSIYRRSDGTFTYIEHGGMDAYTTDFDRDEVNGWWAFQRRSLPTHELAAKDLFLDFLAATLTDVHVDDIKWCASCSELEHVEDGGQHVRGGDFVCEPCLNQSYNHCEHCEEYVHANDTRWTWHDNRVCYPCLDRLYSWCDDCDGYRRDNNDDDHYHDDDDDYDDDDDDESAGCCESPAETFRIPNDGEPPLENDTPVTVTLPAGLIDEEGMFRIRRYIQNRHEDGWRVSDLVDEVGPEWQKRDGNWTKRFSRLAYQRLGQKIDPAMLSYLGTIAREHSIATDLSIEVTRRLNMSAEYFYHEDSCWWGGYSSSRCALKTNGGFGMRSFNQYGRVSGRAWVMPLRKVDDPHAYASRRLEPTFETFEPDAYVVFNGYGDLDGYKPARILSHMAGWTYRKVSFACEPMFINAGGYLVAPEELASQYDTHGAVSLAVDRHSDLFTIEAAKAADAPAKELIHAY